MGEGRPSPIQTSGSGDDTTPMSSPARRACQGLAVLCVAALALAVIMASGASPQSVVSKLVSVEQALPLTTPSSTALAAGTDPTAGVPVKPSGPTTSAATPTPGKLAHEVVNYGAHPRQSILAQWFPGASARAGVVLVHGGHWTEGGRWQFTALAKELNEQGLPTFAVHYRYNTQAVWPAQRDDVGAALAYIRTNAAHYSVDPQRLLVVGLSAGGHLALSQALLGNDHHVAAVAAVSAPVDPWQSYTYGQLAGVDGAARKLSGNARLLLGCLPSPELRTRLSLGPTGDACADQWRDSAVATHLSPGDPAILLMHAEDDFVSIEPARQLATLAQRNGVHVSSRRFSGHDHGLELLERASAHRALMDFLLLHSQ